MKSADIIAKMREIEDFVRQIHKDSQRIKGIQPSGHTYLVGKAGYTDSSVVKHDKGSCSVYFGNGGYFSLNMTWNDFTFSATVSSSAQGRVSFDNSSIENYVTHGHCYRELWSIAMGIETQSIVEREIESLKATVAHHTNQARKVKQKIKELETVAAKN